MRRLFIALVAFACFGGAQAATTAQDILAASDAIRNPNVPFGLTSLLIEYKDGKQTDSSTLNIYSKADKTSGQFRNLIRFVAPARDANKLMLKSGNDLWFYDPSNKASVKISPQQRLLGQAANGDVVTINLSRDYQAELAGEEEVTDGDVKPRACHKLLLAARTPEVTYQRIEMWIEKDSNRPVKAKFFTESGRLLKTAYYRRYLPQLGQERPTETVIIDGLNAGWVTVIRNSDYVQREVPEAWLQRDYLQRFKPE